MIEGFKAKLRASRYIVQKVAEESDGPLVINFSGGKDSMAMLGLVREISEPICFYMISGLEFEGVVDFAKESAERLGMRLYTSTPEDHLGGFFERLKKFNFPAVRSAWCSRDLKIRPQHKALRKYFGDRVFFKLVGVRRSESHRRRRLYKADMRIVKDNMVSKDFLVYPILDWSNEEVEEYLRMKNLPTSSLYKKYGVSGCSWCPFYQESIYRKVLRDDINFYNEIIEWENIKNAPSVTGFKWMRDIKQKVKEEI